MTPGIINAVDKVDFAFLLIFGVSVFILAGITITALVFIYKYHHTRHPEAADIDGSVTAELIWTIIPTAIVLALFWFGWTSFQALRAAPESSMNVQVEARMWSWSFIYENGKRSSDLYVPANAPVKLDMTSLDVIHSFFVPAFRIKMDTVPGMSTYAWFLAEETGDYDILCAEYCGLKHSDMLSTVHVLPPDEFAAWLAGEGEVAASGTSLLDKYGCSGCHSMDGTPGVGPSLNDIYGVTVKLKLADGSEQEVARDTKYIRTAIVEPNASIVSGYDPIMPPYEGTIPDEDLQSLVDFLAGGDAKPRPLGRAVVEEEGCLGCHSTDGSIVAGPSFKGMYGASRAVLTANGAESTGTLDDEAIHAKLRDPMQYTVKDYSPMMPPYDYLDEERVSAIVDYLKETGAE